MPQRRPPSTLRWPKQYDLRTPPRGGGPGSGPSTREEGVYTPTAHEAAPGGGDGPGSPPGGASRMALAGCDYDIGGRRRASALAAPPGSSRVAKAVRPTSHADGPLWGYSSEAGTPAGGVRECDLSSTTLVASHDLQGQHSVSSRNTAHRSRTESHGRGGTQNGSVRALGRAARS